MRFLSFAAFWTYCCFCFLVQIECNGQLNLNIHNGLPTNHTYCIVSDRYGYLWIATERGVVRYNGYDLKIYNSSDGMANEDVWELHQDKQGKIWLFSISNTIGYIYDNKYRNVWISKDRPIYPSSFYFEDSSVFLTDREKRFFRIENDSIRQLGMPMGMFTGSNIFLAMQPKRSTLYTYVFANGRMQQLSSCNASLEYKKIGVLYLNTAFFKTYEINYNRATKKLYAMDYVNCSLKNLCEAYKDKSIAHIHAPTQDNGRRDYLHIICEKQIDVLDSNLNLVRNFSISSVAGDSNIPGYDVDYFRVDSFWGFCTSTQTRGAYIGYGKPSGFNRIATAAACNHRFLSYIDGKSYWYSPYEQQMLQFHPWLPADLKRMKPGRNFRELMQYNAEKLIPYNKELSLLLAYKPFWFSNKTGEITHLTSRFKHVVNEPGFFRALDGVFADSQKLYLITSGCLIEYRFLRDTIAAQVIDSTRYVGIGYEPATSILYAYTGSKILFYKGQGKKLEIKSNDLRSLGINKIDKVLVDRFGNVFLHENDRLLIFDPAKPMCRQVLANFNLENARVELNNDRLVVGGKFGVLFCMVKGRGHLSEPVVYHNVKNSRYTVLNDMQIAGSRLLVNTDHGPYMIDISDSALASAGAIQLPYRFLLSYNKELRSIVDGDTIPVLQGNSSFIFDIVKPSGNGNVKYMYRLGGSGSWLELNANELVLPSLEAGFYHELEVKMKDDVWMSSAAKLHLYVLPYWWQKAPGKQFMWFLAAVAVCSIMLITVLITRRILIRNEQKRSARLELELKSIYAQINPHFIYNTLGSALLLIHNNKTLEAYTHISKFSRLLRSYVKSSRNKYVPLNEEVVNLRNYIELQQTRFKDKFQYHIVVDEVINPDVTIIPSLLLQPFVENAINHGLVHLEGEGYLGINFAQRNNHELACIIDDNGVGRNVSASIKQNSEIKTESYGNELIKDLVSIFKKYEKMHIDIQHKDKAPPERGTIVEIIIKKSPHE